MGLRLKLRLRTCVISGPRGEGEADSVAKHILIFHALAGTCSSLRIAKTEYGCALGHAQHLAATVVRQAAEPELHSIPQALVNDDREVVHIEEVETRLCFDKHSRWQVSCDLLKGHLAVGVLQKS